MNRTLALIFLVTASWLPWACSPKEKVPEDLPDTAFKLSYGYSCNADSVILYPLITDPTGSATLHVRDNLGRNEFTVPASTPQCALTHIPGGSDLEVEMTLLSGGETKARKILKTTTTGYDRLFSAKVMPDKGGVSIGDGTYSVALPDGKTLFIFQDSNVGEIQNGKLVSGFHMYRNSYSLYDPQQGTVKAIVTSHSQSAAIPPDHPDEDEWYWPCDGFTDGNNLYIFQMQHKNIGGGMWGFAYKETRITTYSLPDLTLVDDSPIPYELYGDYAPHFGSAVMKEGEWAYLYACVNYENSADSDIIVARTKASDLLTSWEFWDGSTWRKDGVDKAVVMHGLDEVYPGTQFSVFKAGGKYILLNYNHWFWIPEIYTLVSDSPAGPWTNKKTIYKIPPLEQSNWFAYNAVAHPQFERDGMIPFSFNVNTDKGSEHYSNVLSYRPRFVWVDIQDILE